ncbi:MAG: sensor histidine kinase [Vicinamibacterales bacterium]
MRPVAGSLRQPAKCATPSIISTRSTDPSDDSRLSEQLRALTERLQRVREVERTRVARELHDELGQSLASIKRGFAGTVPQFQERKAPPDVVARVQSAMMHIDLAIATVRRIADGLRPQALDDRDLGGAVDHEAQVVSARSGISVRVVSRINVEIPPEVETAAFRIFQEALLNSVRHARPSRIVARVSTHASRLLLCVRDDGIGCPDISESSRRLGLIGMHERARSVGGRIRIRGRSGRGTLMALQIPLNQ